MNIPAELKALPQWVLWRYEDRGGPKKTKVPYSVSGFPCDITKRESCATFDAVMALRDQYDGVGIVLFDDDNVTAIDCDNPFEYLKDGVLTTVPYDDPQALEVVKTFRQIVVHLNTYFEWSPSGKGLRGFVFGKLPADWGKRNGKVEIYGRLRFVTVTGNPYNDPAAPHSNTIEHRQYELEELGRELKLDKRNNGADFDSAPETRTDDEVLQAVCTSKIGPDFLPLYNGELVGTGDGSAQDQSLANYLCYFTDSKEQAYRLFVASGHYRNRPKLHERTEYLVSRVINNGFDKKQPKIDFGSLLGAFKPAETEPAPKAEVAPAQPPAPAPPTPDDAEDELTRFPEGLLGFIADYIYRSAPYGVPEYALAGAIGLLAGIAGRAFNYSGSGLNQYTVVVGRSGSGKDSISSGISRLLSEYEQTIPAAKLFQGPDGIASEPALYKLFDREKGGQPSIVCMMPEFGEWLQVHLDPRADHTKKSLVRAIMAIYTKSTKGNEAGGLAYSDREKNVKTAKAPAFSFIGDTVPHTFYEACTEAAIEKGLLPRLLVIERKRPRPELNKLHYLWRADSNFLSNFGMFITRCIELNQKDQVTQVAHTEEAGAIIEAFRLECDAHYHKPQSEAAGNMWSRGHVKAMRLAALCAVGVHWFKPVITADQARWACALARRDIDNMLKRMNSGEIETQGNAAISGYSIEQKSIAAVYVAHVDRAYAKLNAQHQAQVNEKAHAAGFMRASTFRNMAGQKPCFRKDPRNRQRRIADTIKESFSGVLRVTTGADLMKSDASAVARFDLALDVEYVVCTDVAEMRRLAAPEP
jgi:hypothetical protein